MNNWIEPEIFLQRYTLSFKEGLIAPICVFYFENFIVGKTQRF